MKQSFAVDCFAEILSGNHLLLVFADERYCIDYTKAKNHWRAIQISTLG